jgi:hypothetical protein
MFALVAHLSHAVYTSEATCKPRTAVNTHLLLTIDSQLACTQQGAMNSEPQVNAPVTIVYPCAVRMQKYIATAAGA